MYLDGSAGGKLKRLPGIILDKVPKKTFLLRNKSTQKETTKTK